jgi:hypothetical protein
MNYNRLNFFLMMIIYYIIKEDSFIISLHVHTEREGNSIRLIFLHVFIGQTPLKFSSEENVFEEAQQHAEKTS